MSTPNMPNLSEGGQRTFNAMRTRPPSPVPVHPHRHHPNTGLPIAVTDEAEGPGPEEADNPATGGDR